MEKSEKPACKYGAKCYRKNQLHLDTYFHPNYRSPTKKCQEDISATKKIKLDENITSLCKPNKMKQTTLRFEVEAVASSQPELPESFLECNNIKTKTSFHKRSSKTKARKKNGIVNTEVICKNFSNTLRNSDSGSDKISKTTNITCTNRVTQKNSPLDHLNPLLDNNEEKISCNLIGKSEKDIIKSLFLVDMPKSFYDFFDFCKSINNNNPESIFGLCGLKLVGPFDVLTGSLDLSIESDAALCYYRYYYDPPEFQTVLVSTSGFHIGYWRDDPRDTPVFLASNNYNKDCTFTLEAENIFGAVYHFLRDFLKKCDPFARVKISKLQDSLKDWTERYSFSLEKQSSAVKARQKKVVSKTFHKLGIVVPVDKKTELGYRPLIETDANLKKICKLIVNADDENERETLWEKLQPLITAANIANDECDFGNSLELGINLFCIGSPVFHETIEHLLTTSYSLLNRAAFEEIIKAHLKRRKK